MISLSNVLFIFYLIRDFTEHHLGQIKTVYPEAYVFKQVSGLPIFGEVGHHISQLTVTVEANPGKTSWK